MSCVQVVYLSCKRDCVCVGPVWVVCVSSVCGLCVWIACADGVCVCESCMSELHARVCVRACVRACVCACVCGLHMH